MNAATTTRTIAEIEAELAAAREEAARKERELREEQEKAARRVRNIQRRRAQGARCRSLRPHVLAIQAELAKLEPTMQFPIFNGSRMGRLPSFRTSNYAYNVEFKERHDYRHRGTGEYNITVGDYGDRKTFPLRKDGTYNYAKIAEDIALRIRRERRRQQESQARTDNIAVAKQMAEQMRAATGVDPVVVDGSYGWGGKFVAYTSPKFSFTMEQMHALIVAMGQKEVA